MDAQQSPDFQPFLSMGKALAWSVGVVRVVRSNPTHLAWGSELSV